MKPAIRTRVTVALEQARPDIYALHRVEPEVQRRPVT
jgi:hypothetical protein